MGRIDPGRVAELTAALVALPSHETEGAAQGLLAGWLEQAGFGCDLQEVEPGRPNLIAVRGGSGPFLCSHVDTHPPHDHPDPFTCRIQDDVLVGRGVLDAKGQIAAAVAALESAPEAPATLVVTCDEEGGGLGSERLRLPEPLRPSGGGIVLEPTGLRVCLAQAGGLDIRLEARGTAAHAYAADAGVSALDVLAGALDALDTCGFLSRRHPVLPPPRRHVGRLQAGEHPWRVPAHAWADVQLTLLPGVDPEAAGAEVDEVLTALALGWHRRGADVRHEIVDVCEPIEIPPELPVVGRLTAALGDDPGFAGMPSWTDAGNLLVHHGIPCVIFGAGELGPAHSDREWVRLDDLVRLAEVLLRLLQS